MSEKMNLYFGGEASSMRDEDAANWIEVDVASADELLEFVNKGRDAGGADILDALLPSLPSMPGACLIANALNFGCEVLVYTIINQPVGSTNFTDADIEVMKWPSGAWKWLMRFPYNTPLDKVDQVAEALEFEKISDRELLLPEPIGNAARAFDLGVAFQEFRAA